MNYSFNKCIDNESNMITTMESDHAEIHRSRFYTAYQTTTILGASSWLDFYLITSTQVDMHLKQIDATISGGLAEIYICEGGTTMTMGTSTNIVYNRNRNSTSLSYNTIYKNSSWGTTGTISSSMCNDIISHFYVGTTGTNSARVGASESNSLEWILKQGTTYIIRVYNQGSNGFASLRIHFYEE